MQFDPSFIDSTYSVNKIYTNTVYIREQIKIASLTKVINNTKDSFGSTKKTTNYQLPKGKCPNIEKLSRSFVSELASHLPKVFECHVLTNRCEFWQPKDREEDYDYFNAIRFSAVVNHTTHKVWITPILTVVETPLFIDEKVKSLFESTKDDHVLVPKPLRRNLAITPDEGEDIDTYYSKNQ